nr:helix-turn-helix transcriptional regulator [Wenzhouxiangella sp. XN201]
MERQARERQKQRFDHLTEREFEVASLASSGMTNKAIGLELGISERTVEIHRGRAMKKLGLRTVAELARLKPIFDRLASTE